eukprot:SM000008S22390  [mRNA]  locus=s8:1459854:1462202:- [translate_table: standard]
MAAAQPDGFERPACRASMEVPATPSVNGGLVGPPSASLSVGPVDRAASPPSSGALVTRLPSAPPLSGLHCAGGGSGRSKAAGLPNDVKRWANAAEDHEAEVVTEQKRVPAVPPQLGWLRLPVAAVATVPWLPELTQLGFTTSHSVLLKAWAAARLRWPATSWWQLLLVLVPRWLPQATLACQPSAPKRQWPVLCKRVGLEPAMEATLAARTYRLADAAVLVVKLADITKWHVDRHTDAIVNAANQRMLGGGGVDGAIHRAAGSELFNHCRGLPEVSPGVRCPTGQAVITPAFNLPVKNVIHTVGPVYASRRESEPLLYQSYMSCLAMAKENGLRHVAFPAISCGVYGYPYSEAAEIALQAVRDHSQDGLLNVYFCLFDKPALAAWIQAADSQLSRVDS